MRTYITNLFFSEISPYLTGIKKVAIIGGSESDPEIKILTDNGNYEVVCYGIDGKSKYLDLNFPFISEEKYDLVICSQVLEHIYDVKQGIENLYNLTLKNGYIWVGCPASNRSHGSPNYYSAGYQSELIFNLFNLSPIKLIGRGELGSKRLYFFTHALRVWPSLRELQHPLTRYDFKRRKESFLFKFLRYFYDLTGRIYSLTLSHKIIKTVEYGTETWILVQKTN